MGPSAQTIAAIRFGYGFHPDQVPPRDADDLMRSLAPGAAFAPDLGGPPMAVRARMFQTFFDLRARNRNNDLKPKMRTANREIQAMFRADLNRRIFTPVRSPYGFYERLAWFWGDHFAVTGAALKARSMIGRFEADTIRPHIAGRFSDMLRAASTHPSMLDFLNQTNSVGPNSVVGRRREVGLNENLAREIIELHTLGVSATYTQNDVRQFAELLTGLTYEPDTGAMMFTPRRAEPGAEEVLGVSYGGQEPRIDDIYRALDDLAVHPATARHIAEKLARHFTSDDPSASLIGAMEAAFIRSDGDLPTVYAALLDHPDSWASFGQKVKQPFDFVVSSIRATGPTAADMADFGGDENKGRSAFRALRRMNQMPYTPPGPQGWPEAPDAWITPQGLTERISWASNIARAVENRIDPRDFVETALTDHITEETLFAATRAAERWEGIALVLASPKFNRR